MELITSLEIFGSASVPAARFVEDSRRSGRERYLEREWPFTADVDLEAALESAGWVVRAVSSQPDQRRLVVLAEGKDSFALVHRGRGTIGAEVAGSTDAAAEKALLGLRELFPPKAGEDGVVEVTFCSWSGHHVVHTTRDIQVPVWNGIRRNYNDEARCGVDALLKHEFGEHSGKLALWYGRPGTGKTYAVRALLNAWREAADCLYVMDPERFFGESDEYMLSVVLSDQIVAKRRLIVIEDAGEMLSVDARQKVGQALGRLLNLCDGLVGQGLDLLVLITTNEDVGRLHPAVTRPGRCVSQVEFGDLDARTVQEWLTASGADPAGIPHRAMTLAELFAVRRGHAPAPRSSVGF